MRRSTRAVLCGGALVSLVAPLGVASAANGSPGFLTAVPSMLTPTASGAEVLPILSVGDAVGGFTYPSIPDGIGLLPNGQGTIDAYVSHETSLVPFPYTVTGPTATGLSDMANAEVTRVRLHQKSAGVLSAGTVVGSDRNFQRFCSASIAGPESGFRSPVYFANEEATDFVSPPPLLAWPPDPANQRQAGLTVAVELRTGRVHELYGMGRFNHENTVVIPGRWGQVVTLSGDDTFTAPSSQMYQYRAASPDDLLADKGALYAFVSDDPTVNDYGDLTPGSSVGGHFISVPRAVAVGEQTALESWSNANNVFQFIRIEDIAYDLANPRVVYFADTGEPRAIPSATTTRLARGPSGTEGPYPNGRIFKMVLNANDPGVVDSLSVLVDADAAGYRNAGALHNPDNLATSTGSLMIQEDPGGHNPYLAKVWRYDLATGAMSVAATVNQSLDPAAPPGSWESSGIVDASSTFGPGAWLLNVQAHSLFVETEVRTVLDTTRTPPVTATLTFKKEGGQLLLLRVPGS